MPWSTILTEQAPLQNYWHGAHQPSLHVPWVVCFDLDQVFLFKPPAYSAPPLRSCGGANRSKADRDNAPQIERYMCPSPRPGLYTMRLMPGISESALRDDEVRTRASEHS